MQSKPRICQGRNELGKLEGLHTQWLEPDEVEEAEPGGEGPCRPGWRAHR